MKQPSIHDCDGFVYDGYIKHNARTGRSTCKNGALEINTRGIGKITPTATDMGPSHFQTDSTKGASDRGHSMDKVLLHVPIAMIPLILAHKENFPMVAFMGKVKPHF